MERVSEKVMKVIGKKTPRTGPTVQHHVPTPHPHVPTTSSAHNTIRKSTESMRLFVSSLLVPALSRTFVVVSSS